MFLKRRDVGLCKQQRSHEGQVIGGDLRAVGGPVRAPVRRFDADFRQDFLLHLRRAVADALGDCRFSVRRVQSCKPAKDKANPAERASSAGTGGFRGRKIQEASLLTWEPTQQSLQRSVCSQVRFLLGPAVAYPFTPVSSRQGRPPGIPTPAIDHFNAGDPLLPFFPGSLSRKPWATPAPAGRPRRRCVLPELRRR